jgi:flagellar hook-length control protein FliK
MNPMLLKIVSLPINCTRDKTEASLTSVKGTGNFLASIKESMNASQKKPFHGSTKVVQEGKVFENKYKFYIESLKKRLLAEGKPLNEISLNTNDLFALKDFLFQCGFSRESVEGLLQELAEKNPKGEINIAQFFNKVAELEHPEEKPDQPVSLDISAIPYIESLLRNFGLSPKELDYAFSSARLEGGKLDLKKLVIELKEISNRINQKDPGKAHVTVDRDMFLKVLTKLEGPGIRIPEKETGDKISIKDLITALEQITGGEVEGDQLPGNIKTAIDQIVEKAALPAKKQGITSSLLSFSKLRLNALYSGEKTSGKGKALEKTNFLSILDKKDNTVEKDNILNLLKKNSAMNAENGQEKAKGPSPLKNARLFSASDVPSHIVSSTSSDMINNANHQSKVTSDSLPASLVNQVGRQISRSILRGERVIKLHLHPPELGGIKIDVDIKDNTLKLGVITENSSVKELLLSNAHELRQALVEQGVKLEKLDIQISYNSGQTLTNSKESSKQNQRWGKRTNSISLIGENGSEQPQIMQRIMLTGDCLLDLMA